MGSVTNKFKVGDVVRVHNPMHGYEPYRKRIGVITTWEQMDKYYQVRFDNIYTPVSDNDRFNAVDYNYFVEEEIELAKDFTHALTEIIEN